jgi:hypothetical protein
LGGTIEPGDTTINIEGCDVFFPRMPAQDHASIVVSIPIVSLTTFSAGC